MSTHSTTRIRRAAACALSDAGQQPEQIADTLGVPVDLILSDLGRPTTAEDARRQKIEQAVTLHRDDYTVAEIADRLDVVTSTIVRWLRNSGIEDIQQDRIEHRRQKVRNLALAGHTVDEIATMMRISTSTVDHDLKSTGTPTPATIAKQRREERILALAEDGWSTRGIADDMGIHPSTVQDVRRRHGVRAPGAHVRPETIETARQMILDGYTVKHTAETLGVYPATLRKHLPDLDIPHRGVEEIPIDRDTLDALWRRAVDGAKVADLAAEIHVARITLQKRFFKVYGPLRAARTAHLAALKASEKAARAEAKKTRTAADTAGRGSARRMRERREAEKDMLAGIEDHDCTCGRSIRHAPAPAFKSGPINLPACDGRKGSAAA